LRRWPVFVVTIDIVAPIKTNETIDRAEPPDRATLAPDPVVDLRLAPPVDRGAARADLIGATEGDRRILFTSRADFLYDAFRKTIVVDRPSSPLLRTAAHGLT
jgi:hypothetical protein